MRTEIEWNADHTECRFLVFRDQELSDVTPWVTLRPNRFVRTLPLVTRALLVPLVLIALELLVWIVMQAF